MLFLVVGTRPQIIKSVPIAVEAQKQGLDLKLIHTGQHYDAALSQVFFDELSPPEPLANLNVGSGSQVYQTAEIMLRLEKYLISEKPSQVLIPGDTNSALAGAITAVKFGVPLAHLESGARSYDMEMAEEINRRLIDHCAQTLFAPTIKCQKNLECERVTGDIYMFGDTMLDVFSIFVKKAEKSEIIQRLNLTNLGYAILTTHRAENVDDPSKLKKMLKAIETIGMPVIFPVHPRTKQRFKENGLSFDSTKIRTIDPIGYVEMLALLKHARVVITDSGGLQKEAFWSKTPSITIRDRTEWTETVDLGTNFVTDIEPNRILSAIGYIQNNYSEIKKRFDSNPFGDSKASQKIVRKLKEMD
jgi:UDP-GlcNAc3NAcA epimerase